MNQIIPAILPKSQSELDEKITCVLGVAKLVQVDVCDGIFVPSKTEFESLPFADQIDYELDLMIQNPEDSLSKYLAMSPKRIVIHVESITDQEKLRSEFASFNREIGISISNDTAIEVLNSWTRLPDGQVPAFAGMTQKSIFIQLMGIAKIGFQSQPFDERVLERIAYCREHFPGLEIAVDGGVNLETIAKLRDAGVMRFVCGSAVFSGDAKSNIEKLQSLLQ